MQSEKSMHVPMFAPWASAARLLQAMHGEALGLWAGSWGTQAEPVPQPAPTNAVNY